MKRIAILFIILLAASCGSRSARVMKQSYFGFKPGEEWTSVSNKVAGLVRSGQAGVSRWCNETSIFTDVSLHFFLADPEPTVEIITLNDKGFDSGLADNSVSRKLTLRFVPQTTDAATNYYLFAIEAELKADADLEGLAAVLSNRSRETTALTRAGSKRNATLYDISDRSGNATALLSFYKTGNAVLAPNLTVIYHGLTNSAGR